ncbi:hypothetical protein B0H14DRAFT_3505402 [Mycena olivaceomarginata]|nr:hypothetical protein B0H14DRAFT_3505402 [Mycena olivaceomarginata]
MTKWAESPHQSEQRYPGGVNPADDTMVGVWINGKDSDLVSWFLVEAYVPCFFICELPRSLQGSRTRSSFLEGTNLDALLDNEFHRLASAQGMNFTKTETFSPFLVNLRPDRDLDRVAASLHWQLDVPWACPLQETDNADDAFHRLEIPPISGDAVSKGSWTIYAQDELEEDEPDVGPLMRSRGSKAKGKGNLEGDEEMWYDRKLKRKLVFSDLPALPRVLDHVDDEFGRPVPSWTFGGRKHTNWVNDAPSVWMYRREKASRSRVGERYSPPTPRMLSPSSETPIVVAPASNAPTSESAAERMPAEAPAREFSPSNDSVVSLGPEEDVIMTDVGVPGPPERMEAGEIPVVNESTYVLIHGYSFSFGLGDLRLWLRLPSTGVPTDSIAGIFRLLQSNYRVDYFFEDRLRMPAARSELQDGSLSDDPRAPRHHSPLKELEDEALRSLGYPNGDHEVRLLHDAKTDDSHRNVPSVHRITGAVHHRDMRTRMAVPLLLDGMNVGLKERVSTIATSKRRRAHNRPLKRLERLLRMEEEIRRKWEEFRWTDAEIDWIIDQEEMLPPQDQMDED